MNIIPLTLAIGGFLYELCLIENDYHDLSIHIINIIIGFLAFFIIP